MEKLHEECHLILYKDDNGTRMVPIEQKTLLVCLFIYVTYYCY